MGFYVRSFILVPSVPSRCTICQYQCTSKASLDKHIHLVHKKERPFACQVCQRRFGQKVHLNVHMNAVHLKDRPYHCDECGYSAATKGLVQKHVSTVHRKEKPFACEICSSRFGQKVRGLLRRAVGVPGGPSGCTLPFADNKT